MSALRGKIEEANSRLCPEYHPAYYGAFARDPDESNVEAVCHFPE